MNTKSIWSKSRNKFEKVLLPDHSHFSRGINPWRSQGNLFCLFNSGSTEKPVININVRACKAPWHLVTVFFIFIGRFTRLQSESQPKSLSFWCPHLCEWTNLPQILQAYCTFPPPTHTKLGISVQRHLPRFVINQSRRFTWCAKCKKGEGWASGKSTNVPLLSP